MNKKAVILLSGGLDSATVAAWANSRNYDLHALSFSYGQRHDIELECSKKIAIFLRIKDHRISKIDLSIFGGSSLTDKNIAVEKNRANLEKNDEIPTTYVPARNVIFLSYALAFAESIGAKTIFIGANKVDYSGYPDCRPAFLNAFENMGNLATKMTIKGEKITISTPLLDLTKAEIIKMGVDLNFDYSLTHSCYDPVKKNNEIYACGKCDSCLFRLKGFRENNLQDPILYLP